MLSERSLDEAERNPGKMLSAAKADGTRNYTLPGTPNPTSGGLKKNFQSRDSF